jgi:hypothetical protein
VSRRPLQRFWVRIWLGLSVTLVLLVAAGGWLGVRIDCGRWTAFWGGRMGVAWWPPQMASSGLSLDMEAHGSGWTWGPDWFVTRRNGAIEIPTWPLPLLTGGVAALLWRRRLPEPPGRCPSCTYNLAGNTTGVCPECGAPQQGTPIYP